MENFNEGTWYQSAVSGMWYKGVPESAGDITAVKVNGVLFGRLFDPSVADKRKELLDGVVAELLNGLITDGGHHKQYSLEKAMRMLVEDEWVDGAKNEFQWEEGIPS